MNNKAGITAIALIVGLVAGGAGGYAIGAMNESASSNNSSTSMTKTENKEGVLVGGALMVRDKDIVDNAVEAPDVTTVVSLVKLAGLVEIPVIIHSVDNETAMAMALVENLQREDLNPVDQARAIGRLIKDKLL